MNNCEKCKYGCQFLGNNPCSCECHAKQDKEECECGVSVPHTHGEGGLKDVMVTPVVSTSPKEGEPRVTCLSLDCPERTGGKCRHDTSLPKGDWRDDLDELEKKFEADDLTWVAIKSVIDYQIQSAEQRVKDQLKEVACNDCKKLLE